MSQNCLNLNGYHSEFIVFGSKQQRTKVKISHFRIDTCNIVTSAKVRNLGTIIYANMSLNDHISSVSRNALYHLRTLSLSKKYLRMLLNSSSSSLSSSSLLFDTCIAYKCLTFLITYRENSSPHRVHTCLLEIHRDIRKHIHWAAQCNDLR
ncbi:hypothetical protein HOLleu_28482 [Holothuria leucospilota]|uniref:Uncharacterized protein n=1 Tax=Holothuria leucospilota TaxID=206669 RepID=A0A9Q1BM12_HOLLE|nr:hypothetical protein HOLleu_28482 [Holothuria leucospilota]